MRTLMLCICIYIHVAGTCFANTDQVKAMDYRVFIEHLGDQKVSEVEFTDSGMLVGFEGDGSTNRFVIQGQKRPFHSDPLLLTELKEAGVVPTFSKEEPPPLSLLAIALIPQIMWSIIPIVILVLTLLIFIRVRKIPLSSPNSDRKLKKQGGSGGKRAR